MGPKTIWTSPKQIGRVQNSFGHKEGQGINRLIMYLLLVHFFGEQYQVFLGSLFI
jgi:hypothetical protein